jgi:hypothetical protein
MVAHATDNYLPPAAISSGVRGHSSSSPGCAVFVAEPPHVDTRDLDT